MLSITNINLGAPASLTLSAPAGSTFVLNITGGVTIDGANESGLRIAGGLTSNDVVYNFVNGGTLATDGGMAERRHWRHPHPGYRARPSGLGRFDLGAVDGTIITLDFRSSGGSQVNASALPEANPLLPVVILFGTMLARSLMRRCAGGLTPETAGRPCAGAAFDW